MKRVGVDAHVLTGKYQGSRTYLENILQEIGRQDPYNRYVIYSHAPKETRALLPFGNFEHIEIGIRSSIGRLSLYWPWAKFRHGLDLLITQYNGPPVYPGAQFLIIHDLLFESHPEFFPTLMRLRLKLLCRYSATRARTIFTVSEFSRQELIRRYGIPDERIRVTPNGAPVVASGEEEAEAGFADLRPYLLFVGRLEPRKNLELLLRASRKARASGVKLVVVGREDFRCRALAEALALEPGVVHLRDVSPSSLAGLYRLARVLVFPSLGEGFGIPVLEAIRQGTPVIASNQTAIPEAGAALARYFDPTTGDAEGRLASEIEHLLDHPYRLPEDLVREHIARFSWAESARTIIESVNRA